MNDDKMTSLELRATWGLGSVFSLRMLGMFMVLPVLTTYGMALQGATESLIGLAIGIYGLAQALFQIPIGLLSDKLGRKPLIVGGLGLFVVGSLVAALTHSIWGVILGRALQGSGAIAAAVMALLSDLTREQNRTKAMAVIGISFGITFAIAMVLGPLVTHHLGLNALFWMIAILASLAILITVLIVPTPSTHLLNRESAIEKGSIKQTLINLRLLKLNLGILILHMLLMTSFLALPLQFELAGLPAEQHWKIYLATMLVAFTTVIPFIIVAEVKRKMRITFIGCVLFILLAELILATASHHLWRLIIGVQIFFFAFNLLEAILPSLISKESPAGYKGTAMGIYSTSQFIGVALGGILGGTLLGHVGPTAVFVAGIVLAIVWLFVSFTMKEPPYVSSLRLQFNQLTDTQALTSRLQLLAGVSSVLVVAAEQSIYIKTDSKITNRKQLEQIVDKYRVSH